MPIKITGKKSKYIEKIRKLISETEEEILISILKKRDQYYSGILKSESNSNDSIDDNCGHIETLCISVY